MLSVIRGDCLDELRALPRRSHEYIFVIAPRREEWPRILAAGRDKLIKGGVICLCLSEQSLQEQFI